MISSKLIVSNDGNLLILGPYSYFHHEGVIELLRPRFFFVILSQRAQPEELNSLKKTPRNGKDLRPSGEHRL